MPRSIAKTHFHCVALWAVGLSLFALIGCDGGSTADVREPSAANPVQNSGSIDGKEEPAAGQVAAGGGPGQHDNVKVSIDNFTFHPDMLEIRVGTTVTWVNGDDVPHTVRSIDDRFRSETLDTDDVFVHRFSEPGTYEYYCGVHRHMEGKIIVK